MKVTSIILAGGRSQRLGRNKAILPIRGKSLIERVMERVKLVGSQTIIVTSQEKLGFPPPLDAKVLVDLYPGKGPLAGIYTGLIASSHLYSVVVACDMPFLNVKLLRYMIELSPDFDAVVPKLGEGMVEPLHAVYSKTCSDKIKAHLEHDQFQVNLFLDQVRVRYVERVECQGLDPQLLSFFNINSHSDLDRATMLIEESK
jgi:molybdopterin-guanine dinucleotide biosynthesis protein A